MVLKSFAIQAAISIGWDCALSLISWLLKKGYISFEVSVGEGHPLWKKAAKITKDGIISKSEVIDFLRETSEHIPGNIDDIIINVICMALGYVDNFEWDASEQEELFEAIALMIEDGKFTNFEAAIVLDAVNSVSGLLKK